MNHFCTYLDHNYLPKFLTLHESLMRYAKGDFLIHVLCLSRQCSEILEDISLQNVTTIPLAELEQAQPELAQAKANRSTIEYYFTLTPCLPRHILDGGVAQVTYLDADLVFHSDPQYLFDEAKEASVIITPHRFAPGIAHLAENGLYNVSWLTFSDTPQGRACLDWYWESCIEWCYDKVEADRFADQKYLDRFPVDFADVHVLEAPGAGLAPWNMNGHDITVGPKGVLVDGTPLVFCHMHGFKRIDSGMYESGLAAYGSTMTPELHDHIFLPYLETHARWEAQLERADTNGIRFRYRAQDMLTAGKNAGTIVAQTPPEAREALSAFRNGVVLLASGKATLASELFGRAAKIGGRIPLYHFAKARALAIAQDPGLLASSHTQAFITALARIETTTQAALADPADLPEVKKENARPTCLFLCTYYPGFLERHYGAAPELATRPYAEQLDSLLASNFGDSDFYSNGLKKAGWDAVDVIANCDPLQTAWANEHACKAKGLGIAVEQIRRMRPDVVYIHDLSLATKELLEAIRPHTKCIAGQIASPLPPQAFVHGFDIIFSSFPHFVDAFRDAGITSYYQPLAFAPEVLEQLPNTGKQHDATFVGGISGAHAEGTRLLEAVAGLTPLKVWGYGAQNLRDDSPLRAMHCGEAWGMEMFERLAASRVTINRHIDTAAQYANNMRLFEATGCGAMLVTDAKENLANLFEPGREVVVYDSPEDCAAKVAYYAAHPEEAATIAAAGQARTLRDHTYDRRMRQTAEILKRHLRHDDERRVMENLTMQNVSTGYSHIQADGVEASLTTGWQDASIPQKQRALVHSELDALYKGRPTDNYSVLAGMLAPITRPDSTVLEIGCSSGYYYEVLEYLMKKRIRYTGADYSEPLIAMARDYYPEREFVVADGANLPFDTGAFEVAISSCVLLHVPNWHEHVAETARVAGQWVIAHRTPIIRNGPTQHFKKEAYGVPVVELHFNEAEFVAAFAVNGLKLAGVQEISAANDSASVTYLFRKQQPHLTP